MELTGKLEGPKNFWDARLHRLDTIVTQKSNKKKNSKIDQYIENLGPIFKDKIALKRRFLKAEVLGVPMS